MSDNNYCGYRGGKLCISPDGKVRSCSIDIESIYGQYAKENAMRMCERKQTWDSEKNKLETKVQ